MDARANGVRLPAHVDAERSMASVPQAPALKRSAYATFAGAFTDHRSAIAQKAFAFAGS